MHTLLSHPFNTCHHTKARKQFVPSILQCAKIQSSQHSSSDACQFTCLSISTTLPTVGNGEQKAQRDCISPVPRAGVWGFCTQQALEASQTAALPRLRVAVCSSQRRDPVLCSRVLEVPSTPAEAVTEATGVGWGWSESLSTLGLQPHISSLFVSVVLSVCACALGSLCRAGLRSIGQ